MERMIRSTTEVTLRMEIKIDQVKWQKFSGVLLESARAGIFVDIVPPVVETNNQPFWTRQWRKGHKR